MKQLSVILFSLLLSFICINTNAQGNDVSEQPRQRILILPFDPDIYMNDASQMWSDKSGLSNTKIRNMLRTELNRQLHIGMIDSCESVDLFTSYTKEARNEVLGLYTYVRYELRRAMPDKKIKQEKEEENQNPIIAKLFKKKEKPYTDTVVKGSINTGELHGKKYSTHDKYLHILFDNPEFIPELCHRRKLDKILFVNQFEINGNYGSPYISGNNQASRTLKVHYSLFDFKGKLLHGSFAAVDIPFTLDDYQKVIDDYYPSIVRQIISNIDFKK